MADSPTSKCRFSAIRTILHLTRWLTASENSLFSPSNSDPIAWVPTRESSGNGAITLGGGSTVTSGGTLPTTATGYINATIGGTARKILYF